MYLHTDVSLMKVLTHCRDSVCLCASITTLREDFSSWAEHKKGLQEEIVRLFR